MKSEPLVIYHGSCYDGFTAAWIADQAMPGAELYAARYNDPPPDVAGRRVWILDFSYPRETMIRLNEQAESLVVLDHHKTAQANCEGLDFCIFDLSRSGCKLAWTHFRRGKKPHGWLLRIEDRDLWRFNYDDTRDVHAYVASLPMTLENWDGLDRMALREIAKRGRAIRRYIETWIEKAAAETRVVTFADSCVAALNVPYQNASEVGSYLLEQHPECDFAIGWFQRADGRYQFSLRSRREFDVSEVAKRFGGGGHPGAAGFDLAQLPDELQ